MIKKIISIVLVLIGLFFLTGVIALLHTVWGAVFCGVIMLGCFYLAYRLYPRKEKNNVVVPPSLKEAKPELNSEPELTQNFKVEPKLEPVSKVTEEAEVLQLKTNEEPYSLYSEEFNEIKNKAVTYSARVSRYLHDYDSLTEEDSEKLSDLDYEMEITREKLPDNWDRESIYLLNSCFLDMCHVCEDLNYYIDDKDFSWIDDADYHLSGVYDNFSKIADIIRGELDD